MKNEYIGVVLTNRFGRCPDGRERGQVWIRTAYRLLMATAFQDRKVPTMAGVQKSITEPSISRTEFNNPGELVPTVLCMHRAALFRSILDSHSHAQWCLKAVTNIR